MLAYLDFVAASSYAGKVHHERNVVMPDLSHGQVKALAFTDVFGTVVGQRQHHSRNREDRRSPSG
jgi:hypothetical protein